MKTMQSRQGYALVTIMSMMAVLAISFAMLMKSGSQSAHMGDILVDRTKATAYAEAGIEYAYAILRDNYDANDDLSNFRMETNSSVVVSNQVITQYGEGTYTLTLTPLENKQYVIINSVGNCRRSTIEVEAMIEDTNFQTPNAWDKAIFSGGGDGKKPSKFSGGVVVNSEGDPQTIHVNGDIDNKGGGTLDANISTTSGEVGGNAAVTGDIAVNQEHIAMPSLEDQYGMSFTDFKTYAEKGGEIGTTNKKGEYIVENGSPVSVGGNGVLYVDGDVIIKDAFVGSIIATGSINIQAGGSIQATSNGGASSALNIAVATKTGPIDFGTTASCTGVFYAESGDFKMTASQANLSGQIIVNGIVEATGGSSITFTGAGEDEDLGANPVIAGWQK